MSRFKGPLKFFTKATKPGAPFEVLSRESRVIFASIELKEKRKKTRHEYNLRDHSEFNTYLSPVSIVKEVGPTGK